MLNIKKSVRILLPHILLCVEIKKTLITEAWTGTASMLLPRDTAVHPAFKLSIEMDTYLKTFLRNIDDNVNFYNKINNLGQSFKDSKQISGNGRCFNSL